MPPIGWWGVIKCIAWAGLPGPEANLFSFGINVKYLPATPKHGWCVFASLSYRAQFYRTSVRRTRFFLLRKISVIMVGFEPGSSDYESGAQPTRLSPFTNIHYTVLYNTTPYATLYEVCSKSITNFEFPRAMYI